MREPTVSSLGLPLQVKRILRLFRNRIELTLWRSRNQARIRGYRTASDCFATGCNRANELRREGIVVGRFEEFFEQGQRGFRESMELAYRLWADARRTSGAKKVGTSQPRVPKDFRVELLPRCLKQEDPFIRLALDPRMLSLVNSYMGMHTYFRAVSLWWDRLTEDPASETQLWHQDHDDVMNVKVFIYFNDVDPKGGPFCYLPRTHPPGNRRLLSPEQCGGRTTDEQMSRVAEPSDWLICTGAAGTVVVCDTCGYHKGLKPVQKDRLMLLLQYTSGTPRFPRSFNLEGVSSASLNSAQKEALGMLCP